MTKENALDGKFRSRTPLALSLPNFTPKPTTVMKRQEMVHPGDEKNAKRICETTSLKMPPQSCCKISGLLRGSANPESENVAVVVSGVLQPPRVTITDGTERLTALWNGVELRGQRFRVSGYIYSEANPGATEPILFLKMEAPQGGESVLSCAAEALPLAQLPHGPMEGSKTQHFLSQWAPFLSMNDLAGFSAFNLDSNTRHGKQGRMDSISRFLEKHQAARKRVGDVCDPSLSSCDPKSDLYVSILQDFCRSQKERQLATLRSNTGPADAQHEKLVVKNYNEALDMALKSHESPLNLSLLLSWHKVLCDGLIPDNGQLRAKNVRVGSTKFCLFNRVPSEMNVLCGALRALEHRTLHAGTTFLDVAVFASAVFMGIIDLHPFSDANGRIARIGVNWALRKAGFPFVIHLFASDCQRKEYRRAIQETRKNTFLARRGKVTEEDLTFTISRAGAMGPLVDLILDRMHKAVATFEALVEEKSRIEENEERLARMFRERAGASSCFICFDDSPNIATLCCGKASHLNCLAEWLSSNTTCPVCRGSLPMLPRPERESAPVMNGLGYSEILIDAIDETEDSDTEETTEDAGELSDTQDDTEGMHDDATEEEHMTNNENADDETAENETTDSTTSGDANPPRAFCEHCRNRPAVDCINNCCGRCCLLYGQFGCPRHSAC